MWEVIVMAESKDDSIVQKFDTEAAARAAFDAAVLADECVNLFVADESARTGWRKIDGDWVRVRGRRCHSRCLENHNETVQCGIDRGACRDPRCWLREG